MALYTPEGNFWSMTERGRTSLARDTQRLVIGKSSMEIRDGRLRIDFHEMALPWPGQRVWPKPISGTIEMIPETLCDDFFELAPDGGHLWSPRMPRASASIRCAALPGGGWQGRGYHDTNCGDRPIERDFLGWNWARGNDGTDDETVILYDAELREGGSRQLALRCFRDGDVRAFEMPERRDLPRGFWGVSGGIACDPTRTPRILRRLEDSPFYTRSLVETVIADRSLTMVQETLDCQRLSNPLVRLMLPFRMPRRIVG